MNDTEYHEKSYLCELTNSRIIRPVQENDRKKQSKKEPNEVISSDGKANDYGGALWQMPLRDSADAGFREMGGANSALSRARPDPLQ